MRKASEQSVNTADIEGREAALESPLPRIRISEIRLHSLEAPLHERFGWSLNWSDRRTTTLIEVRTDAGLTGWGEGAIAQDVLASHRDRVIGRSPFEAEAIYEELRRPGGHQRRRGAPSCPGLDLALWDLMGKALGMPAGNLLGARYRDRVRAYCTALYRKDWPDLAQGLAEEARGWAGLGFRAMKMKIGYAPEIDVDIVRAVREAIGPNIALGVDSNCAYDAGTCIRIGRRLEEFDLMWWEEPLMAGDLAGYRRLRQAIRIPLASGETENADWLIRHYIRPRLLDVVQPDLEHVGLTGAKTLSWLCWLEHLRLVPHNWGSAIRTAATLQWMSTVAPLTPALNPPEVLFEFDQTENPFRDAVIEEKLTLDALDGCVAVPPGPGLGVTVIPEAVEAFRTNLQVIK
jgi:D-galactarolactone cycloisomerase